MNRPLAFNGKIRFYLPARPHYFFQYFIKQNERSGKGVFLYLILPIIGAIFCLYLLISLDRLAIVLGCIWIVLGIIYVLILTKGLKEEPPELGIDA